MEIINVTIEVSPMTVRVEFSDSNFADVEQYHFEIEVVRSGISQGITVQSTPKGNVQQIPVYDTVSQQTIIKYRMDLTVAGLLADDAVFVKVGSTVIGQTFVENFTSATADSDPVGVASPTIQGVFNLA